VPLSEVLVGRSTPEIKILQEISRSIHVEGDVIEVRLNIVDDVANLTAGGTLLLDIWPGPCSVFEKRLQEETWASLIRYKA
jgi:hypothetical protein